MRKLEKEEYDLVVFLLNSKSQYRKLVDRLEDAMVEEMDDGKMGSLRFIYDNMGNKRFGKQIAEITLLDVDGIPVSFALNIDNEGAIYELDVFKADSSPLKQFPLPPYIALPPDPTSNSL